MKKILYLLSYFLPTITLFSQSGWVQQSNVTNELIHSVSFINPNIGIIADWKGNIFHTTNGGETWMGCPTGGNNQLQAACLVNENTGFVAGVQKHSFYGTNLVLRTTDGGTTWTDLSSSLPVIQDQDQSLLGISFVDVGHGWVVGYRGSTAGLPVIFRTTDGGETWKNVSSGRFGLHAVCFIDTNNGIAAGYDSYILHTTNGGLSWTGVPSPSSNYASISFADANTGLIVGNNGIVNTTNGGNSWKIQSSGSNYSLLGVSFPDINTGFAVGWDGTILKTTDGGEHWTIQSSGTKKTLSSVCFTDQKIGTIVGDSGIIMRTTTGGLTGIEDDLKSGLPKDFKLEQNYPNPFNSSTTIRYLLPSAGNVQIKIYDILGNEIVTLINDYRQAGKYEAAFDGSKLSSGIYFYQMKTNQFSQVKKFILLK